MSTRVYGTSDDLVEVEGDVQGETICYGTDDNKLGVLLVFSDGTLLEVKYGKAGMAIWEVKLLSSGTLFERIDLCFNEDENPYSDVAHLRDGMKWGYVATEWGRVK
jgi:hypothetical protein